MRIRELSLERFGRFTDKKFDFGERSDAPDFHIVYGPNESGKTTTMEGFLRLLYGFPGQDPYDYQHQRKNLCVSGILEIDGKPKHFTRLSGRHGNLVDENGTALAEQEITTHLRGLTEPDDYRKLLCLDDDTIEKGGEDIANARGDIGKLLFSATAGIADLSAMLEGIQDQAKGIYNKKSRSTRIATLRNELSQIAEQIKEIDVSANEWKKREAAFKLAERDESEAKEEFSALLHKKTQLESFARVLPKLAKHDSLKDEIADFANYPARIDIDPESLVDLKTEKAKLNERIDRLTTSLAADKEEHSGINVNPDHLTLEEHLTALNELRDRMRPANIDLPKRQRECENAHADMVRIARDIGATDDVDPITLVKSPSEIASLEKTQKAMHDAGTSLQAEKNEVNKLGARVKEEEKALDSLMSSAPLQSGVIEILSRFEINSLASAHPTAVEKIRSAENAFKNALLKLAVDGQEFTELPLCPMDHETAKDLHEKHAELEKKINGVNDYIMRHNRDAKEKSAQIEHIKSNSGVINDAEASAAKDKRDGLWKAHKETLTAESAESFEISMGNLDKISSLRLERAEQLGQLRQLEQDKIKEEENSGSANDVMKSLVSEKGKIEERIAGALQKANLPLMIPASLVAWIERHAIAAEAQHGLIQAKGEFLPVLEKGRKLHEKLLPLVGLENPTFEESLSRARNIEEKEKQHQASIDSASDALSILMSDLTERKSTLDSLETSAQRALKAWKDLVKKLFNGSVNPDALENTLGSLHQLREFEGNRRQAERQIETMKEDQRQFSEDVEKLAMQHGIAFSEPLDTFDALLEIAQQAQSDQKRQEDLAEKIKADSVSLDQLNQDSENIDRQVQEHAKLFSGVVDVTTLDALRDAVAKGHDVIKKRTEIDELRNEIIGELSVSEIDAARELLRGKSLSELIAKGESIKVDLEGAQIRFSTATEARAEAKRDLDAVTGGADVAILIEQQSTLEMEIEEAVFEFLELDLGLHLAEEAIRRYRDEHRSGMLQETEAAFKDLTSGSYQKIRTQTMGSSDVLLAIDSSEASKQVGDMSKGAKFQLYLALRAAAYKQMTADGKHSLPFLCDDIFETFDDNRTKQACRLMERIGRTGQAIYLTHHSHVVDIAHEVCEVEPTVHNL